MRKLIVALAAAGLASAAHAADAFDTRVEALARTWDHVNYEVPASARADQAAALVAQADAVAKQFPGRAEPLVWKAIALSTEAGAKGGLGALPLVKTAKVTLEDAEKLNPNALGDASVYTSLGSLYYQVPGFPVGFGDKGKARAYLKKAVAANPTGLDANYFMGDFLFQQGEYAAAEQALSKALAAPSRPGREVSDRGRHAEAQALLAKVRAKKG
jgi:tetratricopeptide (TPR) repeat protein